MASSDVRLSPVPVSRCLDVVVVSLEEALDVSSSAKNERKLNCCSEELDDDDDDCESRVTLGQVSDEGNVTGVVD